MTDCTHGRAYVNRSFSVAESRYCPDCQEQIPDPNTFTIEGKLVDNILESGMLTVYPASDASGWSLCNIDVPDGFEDSWVRITIQRVTAHPDQGSTDE